MIICESCDAEFKVKVLNELPVKFCPCCGEAIHNDADWEDEIKYEDEECESKR